jgi:hypothetical protein
LSARLGGASALVALHRLADVVAGGCCVHASDPLATAWAAKLLLLTMSDRLAHRREYGPQFEVGGQNLGIG